MRASSTLAIDFVPDWVRSHMTGLRARVRSLSYCHVALRPRLSTTGPRVLGPVSPERWVRSHFGPLGLSSALTELTLVRVRSSGRLGLVPV